MENEVWIPSWRVFRNLFRKCLYCEASANVVHLRRCWENYWPKGIIEWPRKDVVLREVKPLFVLVALPDKVPHSPDKIATFSCNQPEKEPSIQYFSYGILLLVLTEERHPLRTTGSIQTHWQNATKTLSMSEHSFHSSLHAKLSKWSVLKLS